MSFSALYTVVIWEFAKRHFCKWFKSKYKKAWEITLQSLYSILARIEKLEKSSWLTVIHENTLWKVYKYEFKVAGSNMSARNSWNRIILHKNSATKVITLQLVYWKWNIPKWMQETAWRKQLIEDNHTNK